MHIGIGVNIVNWQNKVSGPFGGNATLADGLVSAWELQDETDSHGSNDLTNNNTVTFVAKTTGTSPPANMPSTVANFVAASAQRLSHAGIGLTGDISFSISFWMTLDNASQPIYGGTVGNYPNNKGFIVLRSSSNAEIYAIAHNGTTEHSTATKAITYGQWHHVVVTYNASTDTLSFYLDNASPVTVGHADGISTETTFEIGRGGAGAAYHDGLMSGTYVWLNRVLVGSEVADLWNGGDGRFYSN